MADFRGLLAHAAPNTEHRVIRAALDHYLMEYEYEVEPIITRTIVELMDRGAKVVFKDIYQSGKPVVIDWHVEEWTDFADGKSWYQLHYRITQVQHHLVKIPVWEFVTHAGESKWKCPACGIINAGAASFCGEKHERPAGCGRPKEGL